MKTVGIPEAVHARLKRYCTRHGLGLGECIAASITYFEKHGLNPATHESPAAEMNRLIKRVDQVIAFIRKQESDLLRPMTEAVSLSEARIEHSLGTVATAKQLQLLEEHLAGLVRQLNTLVPAAAAARAATERLLSEHARRELEALQLLARLVDAKNKSGFLQDLAKLYQEGDQP
ncbi:BfmA/BtgA family mobilization protein [Pontibacter kalidii]|uniref:BfmA/BtgA family mobilization protein n=1 Tax=Pontibacter kalidii TaxID=2592049 RepID=UPI00225585F0|nr:BfmA/BtgA family mobilization protein [Pontibacter kalidii]